MQTCILLTIALTLLLPDIASGCRLNLANASLVLLLHCCVALHAGVVALTAASHAERKIKPSDIRRLHAGVVALTAASPQAIANTRQIRIASTVQFHIFVWSLASIGCVLLVGFELDAPTSAIELPNVTHPVLLRVCLVVPSVLSLLVSWAILYEAERIAGSVEKCVSRWSYVALQSRAFLLLPLTILGTSVLWSDVVTLVHQQGHGSQAPSVGHWQSNLILSQSDLIFSMIRLLPLVVLAIACPALLRYLQAPECLPTSELRERIQIRCDQANFAPRELLIWNTGHSIRNAAVSGFAGKLRCVLLSDRLLAEVEHDRIERIVLHEVAHAIHSHSTKLLFVAIGMIASIYAVHAIAITHLSLLAATSIVAIFVALGFVFYGQLARHFELQADLWAAERTGEAVDYLRAIADIASGHPNRATWLHPSFQSRCEFLLNGFEKAHHSLRSQFRTTVARLVLCFFGLPVLAFVISFA